MADFTITESAASAKALLAASPSASIVATARGELVTEWLRITAVPLIVFLLGACVWSCIKKSSAWRLLTVDGGSARTEAADLSRPAESNHAALDLEAGVELQLSQGCGSAEDLNKVDSSKPSATDAPNLWDHLRERRCASLLTEN